MDVNFEVMNIMVTSMRRCGVLFLSSCMVLLGSVSDGYSAESVTAKENLEKLIKTNSCRGCDLSGVNLIRVDLADADLEGADLSKSEMYLVNLSRANLRNADLRGVAFGGADLADADLRGADLRGTSLDGAYLGGTLLDGMFVTTTPYENAGVSEIKKEVYIDDPSKPKQKPQAKEIVVAPRRVFEEPPPALPVKESYPQPPEVKKMTFIKEVVVEDKEEPETKGDTGGQSDIFLSEGKGDKNINLAADKKKRDNLARLFDTNRCYDCDLSGMDLSNRNLDGADLEQSDLTGCNLEGADLEEANLKGALLSNANLRGSNLKSADFYRADLTDADLAGANIENTLFDSAELSGTAGLTLINSTN